MFVLLQDKKLLTLMFKYIRTSDIMLYMSKYIDKIKARSMRKNGISIIVIARKLGVSKSSVSLWCRDIILTNEQFEKLRKNMGVSFKYGQRIAAQINKQKRLDEINKKFKESENIIKKLKPRDILIAGACLYWAEGTKVGPRFIFVNSDPTMIKIIFMFLIDILKVDKNLIRPTVQINLIHKKRIKKVMDFWSKYLSISLRNFNKPYFINVTPKKVYENYDNYYGILRLRVLKSSGLQYKMLGLIDVFKKYVGVAQVVRAAHS
jgi:hypothetical protein